jgi:hypothetical protein
VLLLFAAAVAYFGVDFGEAYWRYYQYTDAMKQELRFASNRTDDEIAERLRAFADSLGLPAAAGRVRVRRTPARINVSSQYVEHVEIPYFARDLHFTPRAERSF